MFPPARIARNAYVFEALVLTLPVFVLVAGLVAFTIHRDTEGLQQTTGRPAAPALRP